jgi:hypothetical protein
MSLASDSPPSNATAPLAPFDKRDLGHSLAFANSLPCHYGEDAHRANSGQLPTRRKKTVHSPDGVFVALSGWLGIQFYLWVRFYERGGQGLYLSRPAGVEGWLPIAGLMNFKSFLVTGRVPSIHPAAMFLFMAFLLMSLLLKKSFCSWLCPVGTFSEYLWKLGRKIGSLRESGKSVVLRGF